MIERAALRGVTGVALYWLIAAMAVAAVACGGGTGVSPTAAPEDTGPTGADVLKVTPPPRAEAASAPGMPTAEPPLDVDEESETPKITISGPAGECAFEPSAMSFTLGETVTVEVTARDDDHSFIVQGLGGQRRGGGGRDGRGHDYRSCWRSSTKYAATPRRARAERR